MNLKNRLVKRYTVNYICSDDYDVYKQQIIAHWHIIDKAKTCLVEAKNSSLRDNLTRLNRRTKKYSKSLEMLELSLYLLLLFKNFDSLSTVFS